MVILDKLVLNLVEKKRVEYFWRFVIVLSRVEYWVRVVLCMKFYFFNWIFFWYRGFNSFNFYNVL